MDKDTIQILLQFVQLVTVPATFLIGFVSFKKLLQSHQVSEELKKAEYTNDFVQNFKKIYSDLSAIADVRIEYYERVGLSDLQACINNQEVLKFDKGSYKELLTLNGCDRGQVQDLVSPSGKVENGFIDTVDFCCLIHAFTSEFWYKQHYTDYLSVCEAMSTELNDYLKSSATDEEKQKKEAQVNEHLALIDKLLVRSLTVKETDLLNDLECLCLNTKFGLINYDVVYNLIIQLFQSIVKDYYIELMESILQEEEEGYEVFSNIIDVYNELMFIKSDRLKNIRQKEKELTGMNSDKRKIFD